MFNRRDFFQTMAATAILVGGTARLVGAAARQAITQDHLLAFETVGQVTLLHLADLHAQLMPIYFREPSVNIGVGEATGLPPHVTGADFLARFGIEHSSPEAYALTSEDFVALARSYGRLGGLDRMATLIRAIRAERPGRTLVLDGGDTWQGSYTALKNNGADMVKAMNALGVDAMTAHWEFTYGTERVEDLIEDTRLSIPRRECARYRVGRTGFQGRGELRARRPQHRRHRPGFSLHPNRQSPLPDSELGASAFRRRSCGSVFARHGQAGPISSSC